MNLIVLLLILIRFSTVQKESLIRGYREICPFMVMYYEGFKINQLKIPLYGIFSLTIYLINLLIINFFINVALKHLLDYVIFTIKRL